MSERLAIFAEGLFAKHNGKTAHGVIRYGTRDVVAVIDSTQAGRSASEVVPFSLKPVPIVAGLQEALELGATTLLIGVAPTGGKLDPAWRAMMREAIAAGLNLEAGLHTQMSEDPELRRAATRAGVALRDLRAAPADLTVPQGPNSRAGPREGGAQRGLGHGDRQEGGHARARPRWRASAGAARSTCPRARPAWRSPAGASQWTT